MARRETSETPAAPRERPGRRPPTPTENRGQFILFACRAAAGGMGGAGALGQMGKSKARCSEGEHQEVCFGDVAGIDEAKEELEEIVDFPARARVRTTDHQDTHAPGPPTQS